MLTLTSNLKVFSLDKNNYNDTTFINFWLVIRSISLLMQNVLLFVY